MPKLIKDGQVVQDDWLLVSADSSLDDVVGLQEKALLLPFSLWQNHKAELKDLGLEIGLWFDSDESPEQLKEDVNDFPVLALNFPIFRDGRAYSYAAILRQQRGFRGDLRAIGDVLRDQLSYMLSCGFSSFMIADEADVELLLQGFHDFSEHYQSTIINPVPLFRRR